MKIYKYSTQFDYGIELHVAVPIESMILSVGCQPLMTKGNWVGDKDQEPRFCVWVLIDGDAPPTTTEHYRVARYLVLGTGHTGTEGSRGKDSRGLPIDINNYTFLQTDRVFWFGDEYVWHIFQAKNDSQG